MANYDEVVKRNKDYLTQAQINALAAASKEYNIANAGNRAGALASAREQYDTAYRGLQNMGLAGNPNAAPASGEVPRLQMQVKTPFESYNERLKQVENQRLGALGEQFKQDTIAQRQAEEAARAAQAEAMRRAQLQAAAQTLQSTAFKVGTTVMQGFANKVMGIPSTKKENPAGAAATKAQMDGRKRTEQVRAAAAGKLYNVTSSVNAAQERGAKLTQQYKGSVDTSDKNMYVVDEKAQAQRIQDVTAKARADFDAAQKNVTNLAQARHGGGNVSKEEYENAVAQRDLAKKIADNPDLAKAFVEKNNPNANIRSDANKTIGQFFGKEIAGSLGYEKPTMTDYQFNTTAKAIPDVRMQLNLIDSTRNRMSNGGTGGEKVINDALAELKKMGYTEQQARDLVDKFENDRRSRMNYPVFENAYVALYSHDGEKPNLGINSKETDATYRAVNNLPDLAVEKYNSQMLDNPQLGPVDALWTDQQKALGNVDYMTKEQRDAYNSIYEREGLEAANQYAKDIQPIVEMQRASSDQQFLEQLATEKGVQAWALARATNLIGSVPAMIEKLTTGVKNQYNKVAGTDVYERYSPDSAMSRASNWADIIQSKQSQNILDHYKEQDREGLGKVVNFLYQTGTSMADSAIAMTIAGGGAPWITDVLFFSSAGNQAYKDAIERGGTQEQALAFGVLSGTAEALFEHLSIEHFLNMDHTGRLALIRNMLSQSFAEASEEVSTEIANILSDVLVMKDKSEYNELVSKYGKGGAVVQLLKNVGMAGLGGLASGLGFGVIGTGRSALNAAMTARERAKVGAAVKEYGDLDQMKSTGVLLGGDALAAAEKVEKRDSDSNVGALTAAVQQEIQNLSATDVDSQVAVQRVLDGKKMTAQEASDVMDVLKPDTVAKLGYDTSSPEAFASSYNERVEQHGITSKAERMAKSAAKKFAKAKEAAANRVWANPEQGLAMTTPEGNTVTPMPGNMTAVGLAEQERTGFKTRSSATKGNVTYAVAGMQTREGLTNEQAYDEIQKGLTKEAQKKAQVYEQLADALGVKMVIHDVMVGTNGFIDENGNMHVVLSGKQSVLRVAAHELTHWMKDHDRAAYRNLRQHLIAEVGRDNFEKMFKQKAREYGIDTSTKKGIVVVDDEVCAELCERMLSNEESLTKFAERDTAAAKTLKQRLTQILDAIRNALRRAENRNFGESWSDLIKQQETIESWVEGLQKAVEKSDKQAQTTEGKIAQTAGVTTVDQQDMLGEIKDAKTDKEVDEIIDRHSVDVFEYDMEGYARDLFNAGFPQEEITVLFDTTTKVVEQVKLHRAILDFGPMLSEEAQNDPELAAKEIKEMKQGRAYLPYKQNADPHYKLALDFSTLCRKRILLQTIQERLQAKLGRALSQEETVAIRLELQNLQKNNKEEFGKIEVACALCYVEAARLKSPKVINAFLNNTKAEMQNYFAKKNPATKEIIERKQQEWKVEHEYAPDATKKQMSSSDVTAFNTYSRELREQFESDSVAEQATVDRATRLTKGETVQIGGIKFPGRETFLSASWLEKLKGVEPDIFYAFTDKVRSATRSKAQETDTFYARRDIDMVTEGILGYANAESGFRHQSWSDFVTIHLLDTMASIIEMSTRQAKMHAYTKVPAMVRFLGKTGMMLNMSLIPAGQTGLKLDGTLDFDSVEGMAWETMKELRDMFPETAGNIAIGINDAQIRELLKSPDIDYVIPYHASGMNKNMRGYMDIKSWAEYTSSQNEKSNHRGAKGKSPELAEWFDEKAAAKAEDGYAFMRAASEKYLQLCADAERNLIPKFSQYLTNNGDGSYSLKEGYENYWKLLIDRKMVNQVTGKVILQQAVKPTFDQDTVLGLLEDRITDPTVQQQAKAADLVTEKFSGWTAGKNNASAEAIAAAKDMRDNAAKFAAQRRAAEGGVRNSLDIDDEYMDMAKDYTAGKATPEQTRALEQDVEKAARMAGYNSPKLYHGTTSFGFTKFDLKKGGGLIFASSDRNTAGTYSGETDKTLIKDRYTGDVDSLRGEDLIQTANKYLDNRYEGFELISDAQKQEYADRIRGIVDDTIKRGEEFVSDHNGAFDNKKMAVMDRILDSLLDIRSAETQTDLQHAYDQWDRSLWDLKFMDESICDEFMKQCKASNIGMICQRYLRALLYSGDIYGYEDNGNLTFRYDNTIKAELDSELRRGVYSLYGKLGNNLEIDANGSYWDEITAPDELHMDGLQKTRDIAEKAFALGYDSITIKNLKDNGGQTGYRGAGDIYIFNAENAVKSADPVTYDDKGNIIPLSQRFNQQRDDIRYDLDTETLREIQPPTIEQQVWESNDNIRYSTDTRRKPEKKPGMKPAGREPRVREVDVPQYAKTGNPVSDFVRSFLESDKATDEMVRDLQQKIEDGDWGSYTRLTNKEAMDRASDYIARRSLAQAQSEFHDMVASGKYNVNTRALGLKLLSEAASRGDQKQVLDIAADLRELATDAGQSVQIFNVLKGLGGLGSAWYMQKKIDKLNSKYAKEIAAGKMNEITVDPDLMQDLAEARTTAEVEKAEDEIAKAIALQLPLTWASRISNWRYLAMLGNPTTHFRNITGNALMTVLNTTKDAVATGIEKLAVKDVSERAHAVLTGSDRKTWGDFASKSFKEQEKNLRGTGKYGFENQLKQYMRSFDTKWLNKLAQFNFDKLEQEDLWFIRPAYRNALMQHMKAQGYTLQDGKAGKIVDGEFKEISTEEMNKAIEWASNQAWKATFRDASTVASILNSVSKKLGPVGHVIIEGVMPFKKTPINIARRGIEYSPAGVIMGAVQLAKDVKTGKVTKAQAIDNLASGLVGTALMALGAALAKAGIIRAGGDDDKKLGTYNTDTGKQAYSIQIGNVSFDISALAPSTIPLFMGAALHDALDKNGEGVDPSALVETAASTLNPFMEMSFMSSLNSALKNYNQNGIGGALGNTLLTAAESYGSQFLPTVVGKIGQAFDPTTRTTKSSAASPLGSNLDYYGRSLIKKVPGLEAMLQPDVNVWGRETKKDTFMEWALDWANKFILPFGVKVAQKDAIDDELIRLVETTGNVDILPSDGDKKFKVDGETYPMTAAQYTEFSKDRGQASYAALKEVMLSSAYKTATDEERAGMLQNALSAAQKQVNTVWKEKLGAMDTSKQETGIKAIKGDYSDPALYKVAANYPNMYDKAAKAKSQGVSPDTFLSIYEKKENYVGDDRSDYVRQEIMNSNLTPKQKELMDDLIVSDKGTNPDYSSQGWFQVSMLGKSKYDEAKMGAQVGLKPETYYKVYTKWKTLDAKDANGKTVNGLKKKRAKEYLDSLTLSGPEYSFIWTVMFGY